MLARLALTLTLLLFAACGTGEVSFVCSPGSAGCPPRSCDGGAECAASVEPVDAGACPDPDGGCASPAYGAWSAWSACSSGCGAGTRERTRRCENLPSTEVDCALCGGACAETEACSGTAACAPCALPWGGSLPHGAQVLASAASSVPCGQACVSEQRSCANGVLSGSFQSQTCAVASCPSCGTLPPGVRIVDLPWTSNTGNSIRENLGPNEIIAYRVTPSSARRGLFSTAFTGSINKATRIIVVSQCPGDVAVPAPTYCAVEGFEAAVLSYNAEVPTTYQTHCNLELGKTYFFNVKNTTLAAPTITSCAASNCPFYRAFR